MNLDLELVRHSVEYTVFGILSVSLLLIVYYVVHKFSSIRMLESQILSFRNKTELELELSKKMSFFYSLVSNAVYIGLFGTTLGVLITLSSVNGGNQSNLIASLSLPLISTAVSIVVAVIGNFAYMAVTQKIEDTLKLWDIRHGYDTKAK